MTLSSRAMALLLGAAITTGAAAVACTTAEADAEAAELAALCGGETESTPTDVPDDLRCTGLYAKWSDKTVSPSARAFTPASPLWSDGVEKHRWVQLPDGATIDASKMDDWSFPVGTKAWKEFSVGGRKVETRFFWKVRADRWLQAAYVWSADGTSAKRGEGAELEVDGKPYVVPKTSDCNSCHAGRKDKLLGFEAVNLALPGASGVTLETLVAEQRILPLPAKTKVDLPEDGTGKSGRALAWMHTNCGVSCHSGTDDAIGGRVGLRLRLGWDDVTGVRAPEAWDARVTTLGVEARTADWEGKPRIAPGDPASSLIVELVETRGPGQMPKIGTNVVDRTGADAIRAWISAMGAGGASPGTPGTPGTPPDPGTTPAPAGSSCLASSVAEVEGNDTEATANTIPGASGTYCGTIGQDGDVDVVRFTAPATFAGISLKASTTDDRLVVTVSANGGAPVTLGQGAVPAVKGGSYVVRVSGPEAASYRVTLELR